MGRKKRALFYPNTEIGEILEVRSSQWEATHHLRPVRSAWVREAPSRFRHMADGARGAVVLIHREL